MTPTSPQTVWPLWFAWRGPSRHTHQPRFGGKILGWMQVGMAQALPLSAFCSLVLSLQVHRGQLEGM